jgi:hypothetical protein
MLLRDSQSREEQAIWANSLASHLGDEGLVAVLNVLRVTLFSEVTSSRVENWTEKDKIRR